MAGATGNTLTGAFGAKRGMRLCLWVPIWMRRSRDGEISGEVGVATVRLASIGAKIPELLAPILLMLVLLVHAASAQDLACEQEHSKEEVRRLTDAGTIISVDVFVPNVTVVVDDRAWQRSPLDRKKTIAHDVDCATAGPNNKMLRSVNFRSSETNRELATYSDNELTVDAQGRD